MGFADELNRTIHQRQLENSAEAREQVIRQEYEALISKMYNEIKQDLTLRAEKMEYQMAGGKKVLQGTFPVSMEYVSRLPREYSDYQFEEGMIVNRSDREYGEKWCEIRWAPLYTFELKPSWVHSKVKFSLTGFGRKVIGDLTARLARDNISSQLSANVRGSTGEGITFREFDVFHTYGDNCYMVRAVLYVSYQISL